MSRQLVQEYINLHPNVGVGKVPRENALNDMSQTDTSSAKKRNLSEEDVIDKKKIKYHHLDEKEKEKGRAFCNETSLTPWTDKEVEILVLSHDNADSWKETREAVSREGSERTVYAVSFLYHI